jgi:hypothetical protein
MEMFQNTGIARRIADASLSDVQQSHKVISGSQSGSLSREERNLLEFRGFEADDVAIAQKRLLGLTEEELKVVAGFSSGEVGQSSLPVLGRQALQSVQPIVGEGL